MERNLHTLVEAAKQLEGSTPAKDGEEEERVVFPVCGEIFNQSGYKVIVRAFVTQQPLPVFMEEQGQEAPKMEVRDTEEIEMIPGIEKGENEQLQSQPAEETSVLLGQSDWKDSEAPQEKPQQMEAVYKQGADTKEPTSPNILVEVATQIGADEPQTENIPDFNEEVYDVTPEQSQGT